MSAYTLQAHTLQKVDERKRKKKELQTLQLKRNIHTITTKSKQVSEETR